MITVEDKIRTFSKYVYEKEVKHSQSLLDEVQDKNQEVLQEKKTEINKKCSLLEDKKKNSIKVDSQKIISVAKMEAKNNVLGTRNKVLDLLINEIKDSLRDFTNSNEYTEYMEELIQQINQFVSSGEPIVMLNQRDIEAYRDIILDINDKIIFKPLSTGDIGGIKVESPSTHERIDLTLKGKLDNMINEIGIKLYESLKK